MERGSASSPGNSGPAAATISDTRPSQSNCRKGRVSTPPPTVQPKLMVMLLKELVAGAPVTSKSTMTSQVWDKTDLQLHSIYETLGGPTSRLRLVTYDM